MKFRELLEKISKSKAEELFGQELFGELRGLQERDTEFEKKVFSEIEKFINSNKKSKEFVKFMKLLRDSKIHFPDVLKTDAKTVYRGSTIPSEELSEYLNKESIKKFGKNVIEIPNYTYYPKGQVQSWSKNTKVVLRDFALSMNMKLIPVMYETKVDDDFIFSTKITNFIAMYSGYPKEYEIIRVSDKPIKTTLYIIEQ